MNPISYDKMLSHLGHKIVVAYYGDLPNPVNVSIECEDCHEVIVDCNRANFFPFGEEESDHVRQLEEELAHVRQLEEELDLTDAQRKQRTRVLFGKPGNRT